MKKTLKKACLAALVGLSAAAASADDKPLDGEAKAPSAASRLPYGWQPVQTPAGPSVNQKDWVRTPIDAFVLAKLEAKGLTPSPDADRATFIRRATLDAWGVIPTPEEVAAFVNDTSPDAYEKLVDRLLASPHYGERQGAPLARSRALRRQHRLPERQTRPNMWRYRDYVINAFNQDKPYSRFLQEQLAGDEIVPGDQDVLIATGFFARLPGQLQLARPGAAQISDHHRHDRYGRSGDSRQTVGCARCHNHKTDKFTQKDYFSLQAFFANTAVDGQDAREKRRSRNVPTTRQGPLWEEATKDIRAKQKAIIDSIKDAGAQISQGTLSDR